MKTRATALFTLFLTISALGHAGTAVSGGGPGIVCSSATNPIASVQTLDLYEGCHRFKMCPLPSNEPFAIQVLKAAEKLKKFDPAIFADVNDGIAYIFANQIILPPGVGMQVGLDIGTDYAPLVPIGCHLEAIGYFEKSGQLMISSTLMEAMPPTEQAAFFMHEVLYKLTREVHRATNSQEVRKLVAALFSDSDLSEVKDILPHFVRGNRLYLSPSAPNLEWIIENPQKATLDLSLQCTSGVTGEEVSRTESTSQDERIVLSIPVNQCRLLRYELSVIKGPPSGINLTLKFNSGGRDIETWQSEYPVHGPKTIHAGQRSLY